MLLEEREGCQRDCRREREHCNWFLRETPLLVETGERESFYQRKERGSYCCLPWDALVLGVVVAGAGEDNGWLPVVVMRVYVFVLQFFPFILVLLLASPVNIFLSCLCKNFLPLLSNFLS